MPERTSRQATANDAAIGQALPPRRQTEPVKLAASAAGGTVRRSGESPW